ncbi:MAG: winged helix-turn-helix domain-containing protein, partial [Thaumarchaeota archaeon]|nr:winged helix-turn-helix domain-containing protein [Nitrososphaerota archaeon]
LKVKEISSRMGQFCVIEISGFKLVTPCDTRVKILQALEDSDRTADDLAKEVGASYSTVMDHMDLLERIGIVEAYLKKGQAEVGRRKICFRLATVKQVRD